MAEFSVTRAVPNWLTTGALCGLVGGYWVISPTPFAPAVAAALILGAIAAACLILRQPILVCVAACCVSTFRLHELSPSLAHLHAPLVCSILSLVSISVLAVQRRLTRPPPLSRGYLLFFAIITIEIVFAAYPKASAVAWASSISKTLVMTFALVLLPWRPRDFLNAARIVAISGAISALVAIHHELAGSDLIEGTRVALGVGTGLNDPNDLAFTLILPLSLAIAFFGNPARGSTVLGMVCGAAIVIAVGLTESRGGLLGVAVVLLILARRLLRSRFVLALILVLAGVYLWHVFELRSGGAAFGYDDSAQGRLTQWRTAIALFFTHPIQGIGIGNFERLNFESTGDWRAAHSMWFQIMAETGIVGFAAFVALLARAFEACGAARAIPRIDIALTGFPEAIAAALAGLLTAGSFLSNGYSWPLYFTLALAGALSVMAR